MRDGSRESIAAVTDHFADAFVRKSVARVYMTLWRRNAVRNLTLMPFCCENSSVRKWIFHVKETFSERFMLKSGTSARVFVLRIRVSCAFPTHCTCVEFKLRMKRESTYFETHEYSLAALKRVSTIKYAFLPLANQIVFLQRSNA